MSMPCRLWSFALMMVVGCASVAMAGPSPADKCTASKIKAAGKGADGQLKCWSKAQSKGLAVDPLCTGKAQTKLLDSFAKAELKGGCLGTGDAPAVDSAIGAFVTDTTSALGTPGTNACAASKEKATGKKASGKLGCHAKAVLKGIPVDTLCLQKVEDKFQSGFVKAETKGGCVTTGDAAAIEARVDLLVSDVLGVIPSGTTTTTSTSTTTTTTLVVSFASDVQPIFDTYCIGCHSGATPPAGLDLTSGVSYSQLVTVASFECPSYDRVGPGLPGASYLIFKLNGAGPCFGGAQMPLFGSPLPAGQIQLISDWISQGALNN